MKIRFYVTITLLFCALGLFVGYGPFMRYLHDRNETAPRQTFAAAVAGREVTSVPQATYVEGKPTRIVAPTVNIDLPIIDGHYNTKSQTWTLTNDKAQYALITPLANNKEGNTFIYGHDTPKVFDRLNKLQVGQKITLYADNGRKFTYVYRSSLVTVPTDDSLFYYKGAPILTLQTCTGWKSENRKLFTFDLVEAV